MTNTTRLLAGLLAVLLVCSPAVLAADTYPVDHDHELATSDSQHQFESEGVTEGDVHGLDMSLTIADNVGDTGLSEWKYASSGAVFFRIDYNEEIERTLRIYIADEYWSPRLKEDLSAIESDVAADFRPSRDSNYTVVTLSVDEPTTAVFRVPWHRGAVADTRERLSDKVNETTGFSLPSFGGGPDWQYVPESELSSNTTYSLQTNDSEYTIQYDADESPGTEQWIDVRSCDSTDAPVCTFKKAGQPNQTYLLSKTTESPQVRYSQGTSRVWSFKSSLNDIQTAVDDALDGLASWLPGNDGGDD